MYKYDHTHFTTTNPEASAEFYKKLFGATVMQELQIAGKKLIDLDFGGVRVRLSENTGADAAWKGLRFGLHHICLGVDSMDKFAARLKENGLEFLAPPVKTPTGIQIAFIKTPDNVLIELIESK